MERYKERKQDKARENIEKERGRKRRVKQEREEKGKAIRGEKMGVEKGRIGLVWIKPFKSYMEATTAG